MSLPTDGYQAKNTSYQVTVDLGIDDLFIDVRVYSAGAIAPDSHAPLVPFVDAALVDLAETLETELEHGVVVTKTQDGAINSTLHQAG